MCLFCDIIEGKIPSNKIYEDNEIYAFEDIQPQAKIHCLIVPKKHIESLATLDKEDYGLISKIFHAANTIAKTKGIDKDGYRTVFNCNPGACQTVFHLHLHLLGGEQLGGNMSGL